METYRGTAWGQVLERQRDLSDLIDQRLAIVPHTEGKQRTLESAAASIGASEVMVCDHLQLTNASKHLASEVEARNDAVSTGSIDNLTASEAQLEVA